MKKDSFKTYRMLVTIVLAAVIAASVVAGNWYVPGIVILASAAFLLALKHRVRDIVEDERDRKIAGKAAMMSMTVYVILSAAIGTTLVALGRDNATLYAVGSVVLYGPTAFMMLYALLFKWYARKQDGD